MLRITALAAALVATLATPAFAQSFVGQWTATAKTQAGESSESLRVTKTADGYAVISTPATPPPEGVVAGPSENVVVDGNNFSFSRKVTYPGGSLQISYKGVVSGDAFTGTAELGGADVPWNGVRVDGK